HGMTTITLDFGRIGVLQPQDVAGELDHGALQAQADAEEGHAALAGVADRLDLAGDAAVAEAAWHQHAVHPRQHTVRALALDVLRLNLAHQHARLQRDPSVVQRLVDGLVRVLQLHVLADDGDRDLLLRVEDALEHGAPVADVERLRLEPELLDD